MQSKSDAAIERLMNENAGYRTFIDKIKLTLSDELSLDGLSVCDAVSLLISKYAESQTKIYTLELEIKRLKDEK